MVKNLPEMQETHIWSLGQEDPLEKEIPIHSGILAWRIPWTEEPSRLQSMGWQRVGHESMTNTFTLTFFSTLLYLFLYLHINSTRIISYLRNITWWNFKLKLQKRKGNDQFHVSGKLTQSRLLKGWIDARKLKVYSLILSLLQTS